MYKFLFKPCSPKPVFAHGRTMATFCLPPTSFHPTPMMSCSPPELTYHNWGQSVFFSAFLKNAPTRSPERGQDKYFPHVEKLSWGGRRREGKAEPRNVSNLFWSRSRISKLSNTHIVVIVVTAMSCSSIYCTTIQEMSAWSLLWPQSRNITVWYQENLITCFYRTQVRS